MTPNQTPHTTECRLLGHYWIPHAEDDDREVCDNCGRTRPRTRDRAPRTTGARVGSRLPRGETLVDVYCRLRPCVWFFLPDAPPENKWTYECMRCGSRRHNPPKAGEHPLAYNEQKRALERTRQAKNYPNPDTLP